MPGTPMARCFGMSWRGMSTGWDPDDIMAAVYYNERNEPDGYVIYWISNEVFHIKDMIFRSEEARTGLWNFVSAHFSMITQVEEYIPTSRWPSCWRTPA